ncbi:MULTISPECIES: hypothetical protein [unclassified Streptomyces]|uniref:hypothetical protein n=1 Tax=unclassified Streptomyces TaxID=2593676 RepID=UPI003D750CE5
MKLSIIDATRGETYLDPLPEDSHCHAFGQGFSFVHWHLPGFSIKHPTQALSGPVLFGDMIIFMQGFEGFSEAPVWAVSHPEIVQRPAHSPASCAHLRISGDG